MSTWNRRAVVLALSALAIAMHPPSSRAQDYQSEIDRLAEDIAVQVTKYNLKNIAVLDFTDLQGNTQEIGRFLAQELITSLVLKERPFKTIDRANLRNILQEQKLSLTGLQNSNEAKRLKISGVDGLIRGTITNLDDGVRITLQIITVENGTIVGGARGTVPNTRAIENLGSNLGSSNDYLNGNASNTPQPRQAGKPLVTQDKILRITLKFFRKAPDNKIKAIFLVENVKGADLQVAWKELQIVDDQGNQWPVEQRSGINFSGYSSAPLTSGSPITAVTVFRPNSGASQATTFNVIGSIEVRTENDSTLSYIAFNDVRLGI